jgi:hypothetical protein
MTDDPDKLDPAKPEPKFVDGPYAVKWLGAETKRKIYRARKRAALTADQLLDRAIDAYLALERGEGGRGFDVLAPGHKGGGLTVFDAGPPLEIDELARAVELSVHLNRLRLDGALSEREVAAYKRKLRQLSGMTTPARTLSIRQTERS